jgi:hypothetical protein
MPEPALQCLADILDGPKAKPRARDFHTHPVLLIGGDDRWQGMTNQECDVPCYFVRDTADYHKRCCPF